MAIKYLKISCFLYILVSYSQALAGVENCKIVSVTHCHDCAPVKVKCGIKVGYVNNIRLNHIKVEVMEFIRFNRSDMPAGLPSGQNTSVQGCQCRKPIKPLD